MHESDNELAELFFVEDSRIHGKGLFARVTLEQGCYLGEYHGPVSDQIDTYVLWAQDENDRWMARDGKNLLRFINHSNKPCAEFRGFELFALENIQAGREITVDYGDDPGTE